MGTEIDTFKFEQADVAVVTDAKGRWLSLGQLAGQIGIDAEAQRKRLKDLGRSPWSEGWTSILEVRLPGDTQRRAQFMLHSRIVPMWVATMESGSVPDPAVKAQVVHWQKHFANVLADYVEGRLKASQLVSPRKGSRAAIKQWVAEGAVEFYDNGMPKRFDPHAPTFAASLLRGVVDQALGNKEAAFLDATYTVKSYKESVEQIYGLIAQYAQGLGVLPGAPPITHTDHPAYARPVAGSGIQHEASQPGRGGDGNPNAKPR